VTKAYDEFEFHIVYHALYDFCVNDLSALYLDASKDRLYCGGKDSLERRSAQLAMNEILQTLIKLMAPILSFTAEDILRYYRKLYPAVEQSIFLVDLPKVEKELLDEKLEAKWEKILATREKAYQKLEELRANKTIGASIDAQVELLAKGPEYELLKSVEALLPAVFIVSKVIVKEGDPNIIVTHAPGTKCQRCWLWSESVGQNSDHPTLCTRCANAVKIS